MNRQISRSAIAVAAGMLIALLAFPQGQASAQMTKDQQKCANAMNKDFSKVAKAQGKALGDCVKNNAKGSLGGTVSECFAAPDAKGKVAKAAGKTGDDFTKNCVGLDKEGVSKLPTFGVTDPNVVNAAAVYNELHLMKMLFGPERDTVLLAGKSSDPNVPAYKDQSKCQQTVVKALGKCQATMLKEFNKCKKDGLKGGMTDASGLEACVLGLWANPKVSPACGAKLSDAISKKCSGMLGDPNLPLFPGDCDGEADPAECFGRQIWFDTCMALNDVDALSLDCITVTGAKIGLSPNKFDDLAFCVGGPLDGQPCTDPVIPYSDCDGFSCIQNSFIGISYEKFPIRPIITVPLTGDSRSRCGAVDPVTGLAECYSEIEWIDGFNLVPIGFVCFDTQTAPQCSGTFIDCDGGTPADLNVHVNHYVGDCGLDDIGHDPNDTDPNNYVGPSECIGFCDSYCEGLPGSYQRNIAHCEGYCTSGARLGLTCQFDAECPDGACAGGEPVVHPRHCHCHCAEIGGSPSPPGTLVTKTMIELIIYESPGPCGVGPIVQISSPRCDFNTTQTSTSIVLNADMKGVSFSGPVLTGNPGNCNNMAYGRNTSTWLVGHRNYIDTNGGDQESATTSHTLPRPFISP